MCEDASVVRRLSSLAPSMTTPAVTYFQSATSSFRASATMVVLRRTTAVAVVPFLEPQSERRLRLMAQPEPGELDQGGPQSRIPGLGDALLVIDRPALPGRRRKPSVRRDLAAVVEVAK